VLIEAEKPDLVILGKQAIDDDCNQTGQMLSALLGWAQATFASKLESMAEEATVTREIDGGLQTIKVKMPLIMTTDLRLKPAALCFVAQYHEGKKEAARGEDAGRLRCGCDAAPQGRQHGGAAEAPGRRQGEVGAEPRVETQGSGSDLRWLFFSLPSMTMLNVKDATHKALTAAAKLGGDVHVLVAGNKADAAAAQAAKLEGVKESAACRCGAI